MGRLVSICGNSLHLTTRAGRWRALGLMVAVSGLALAALSWSSAAAAHAAHPPRPVITHLSLSGPGANRTLKMTLSSGATVTVAIAQGVTGHAARGHCRLHALKGKRCTVMVQLALHRYNGARGRDSFPLSLGNLPAGKYVAVVVAQNAGGKSGRHTLTFTIELVATKPPFVPPMPSNPIPAPPKPPTVLTMPPNYTNPTPTPPTPVPPTPITPPQARTWGQAGKASTLVVYDTTGKWGYLGELDAIVAGNLATHFGMVTAEPIVDYQSGQINQYTATIYIGTTYDEPIPTVFLNDVLGTTHPVVWAADNIWQLAGTDGSSANSAFQAKFGWDASTQSSDFDQTDNPTTIAYNGQTFTRNPLNGAGTMLYPDITNSSIVKVLATANCSTASPPANCTAHASPTMPWAIRSSNLTYVVEDPLPYLSETDRYLIFSDLLFDALQPSATPSHFAMVRLEDVSPVSDPQKIMDAASYFAKAGVPFSINVIPVYTDPFGINNADHPGFCGATGQSCTVKLTDTVAAPFVAALKYAELNGGTLNDEGYTHQFTDLSGTTLFNPYSGISGDDAEFYQAQCSSTQNTLTAVVVDATHPCPTTDFIVWTGPLPGDSQAAALDRVNSAISLFNTAGLGKPPVWVTPHYFASVPDYQAIDSKYSVRYDREVFPNGLLTGTVSDCPGPGGTTFTTSLCYSRTISQFFPYVVHDVYNEEVLPENLGDLEPTAQNGNNPRLDADIINEAKVNLGVRQGFASFFYDLNDNPLTCAGTPVPTGCDAQKDDLESLVTGIQKLGYTFVGPTDPSLSTG